MDIEIFARWSPFKCLSWEASVTGQVRCDGTDILHQSDLLKKLSQIYVPTCIILTNVSALYNSYG